MKCQGAGGACVRPATTVVIDAKHQPRLTCAGHDVPGVFGFEETELDPGTLPAALLREWHHAEVREQNWLQGRIDDLLDQIVASQDRVDRIVGALHPRPPGMDVLV